ncbi:MAG TPA: type II toxin-antitoxin system VapC family toxin [Terriglobales bacterium]|nr:type II toxin-antitoxin system VapC family toxin [Terriglobales bacterium]
MKAYVFDASALFAFLQNKPGAHKVNDLLKEAIRGRIELLMSAVNYGEVYGAILREYGSDRALQAINAVLPLPIHLAEVTPERAVGAAGIKSKYKLYYVDSFAAALAIEYKATLVTSDSDFRKLGHGFAIVWLKT